MIKLIAFDMDGTFLNSQNDYDRVRFDRIFQAAKEKGIRLVANSGNQYQQSPPSLSLIWTTWSSCLKLVPRSMSGAS